MTSASRTELHNYVRTGFNTHLYIWFEYTTGLGMYDDGTLDMFLLIFIKFIITGLHFNKMCSPFMADCRRQGFLIMQEYFYNLSHSVFCFGKICVIILLNLTFIHFPPNLVLLIK